MKRKIYFPIFAVISLLVGAYPVIYFLIDRRFGLLSYKTEALLSNIYWNVGFYTHIICGGIALLIGWVQFSRKFRKRNIEGHRKIGQYYVILAMLSALAGIGIGTHATGGFYAQLGFVLLGIIWFISTLAGFLSIKQGKKEIHRYIMIVSYAACWSAVTLRIWLPLLTVYYHGDFISAYKVVAWLCWVPNMIFAAIAILRIRYVLRQATLPINQGKA